MRVAAIESIILISFCPRLYSTINRTIGRLIASRSKDDNVIVFELKYFPRSRVSFRKILSSFWESSSNDLPALSYIAFFKFSASFTRPALILLSLSEFTEMPLYSISPNFLVSERVTLQYCSVIPFFFNSALRGS